MSAREIVYACRWKPGPEEAHRRGTGVWHYKAEPASSSGGRPGDCGRASRKLRASGKLAWGGKSFDQAQDGPPLCEGGGGFLPERRLNVLPAANLRGRSRSRRVASGDALRLRAAPAAQCSAQRGGCLWGGPGDLPWRGPPPPAPPP